jgi:hypothetical protein
MTTADLEQLVEGHDLEAKLEVLSVDVVAFADLEPET